MTKEVSSPSRCVPSTLEEWKERAEVVECLAKRICRDLRHALDDVPASCTHKEIMVDRYQQFKADLGDTSEYVHALHYEIRRLTSGMICDVPTDQLQAELAKREHASEIRDSPRRSWIPVQERLPSKEDGDAEGNLLMWHPQFTRVATRHWKIVAMYGSEKEDQSMIDTLWMPMPRGPHG